MKRISGRAAVLVLAALLLPLCAPAHAEAPRPALTIMVYMAGNNLETDAAAASEDMSEMMAALPADGHVEVIAMAAGAREWHNGVNADATGIYRLARGGLELLDAAPLASMGDPDTLVRLLRYGYEACPADEYALILWDHGAGPMQGVCFDELFESGQGQDGLTLTELGDALAASPFAAQKLKWIGLDACLMASIETACALSPYAEYMIASQEPEPLQGWSYGFIAELEPNASGVEDARRIIDRYATDHADSIADITLSCVDLSLADGISAGLTDLFGGFAVTQESYAGYTAARVDVKAIGCGSPYEYDLIDLMDLLDVFQEEGLADCAALSELVSRAIVLNRANGDFRCGLSIYYPFYNKARFASPWASNLMKLRFSDGYRAFLARVSRIWLGESLANWRTHQHITADESDRNHLLLQLSEEEAGQLAHARVVVISDSAPGEYTFVYASEDFKADDLGMLEYVYDSTALYFVDSEGQPQTGSLFYFTQQDGSIVLPTILYRFNDLDEDEFIRMTTVYMVFREDDSGALQLADLYDYELETESFGKSTVNLQDWEMIAFGITGKVPTRDEAGRLLPLSRWSYGDIFGGDELSLDELGSLAFLKLQDDENRFAMFEITDLQNNTYSSELFPLPNANRQRLAVPRRPLVDDERCTVTIDAIEAVTGAHPSLQITYTAINHTDENIVIRLMDYAFNQTPAGRTFFGSSCRVPPGETDTSRVIIGAEAIEETRVALLETLGLAVECTDDDYHTLSRLETRLPIQLDMNLFYQLSEEG